MPEGGGGLADAVGEAAAAVASDEGPEEGLEALRQRVLREAFDPGGDGLVSRAAAEALLQEGRWGFDAEPFFRSFGCGGAAASEVPFHDLFLSVAPCPGRRNEDAELRLSQGVAQAMLLVSPPAPDSTVYRRARSDWRALESSETVLCLRRGAAAQFWQRTVTTDLPSMRTIAQWIVRVGQGATEDGGAEVACRWSREFRLSVATVHSSQGPVPTAETCSWGEQVFGEVQVASYYVEGDGWALEECPRDRDDGVSELDLGLPYGSLEQLRGMWGVGAGLGVASSPSCCPPSPYGAFPSMRVPTPTGSNADLGMVFSMDSGLDPIDGVDSAELASDGMNDKFWHPSRDSWFRRWVRRYAGMLVKCPLFIATLYAVCGLIFVAACWHPFTLELDFGAFMQADGPAQRFAETFSIASSQRKDLENSRRLAETVEDGRPYRRLGSSIYVSRALVFAYSAVSGDVLDDHVLRDVRDFEASLRNLSSWRNHCIEGTLDPWMCDPGESLVAFAYATQTPVDALPGSARRFGLTLDSQGSDQFPLPAVLSYMAFSTENGDALLDRLRYFPSTYALPQVAGASLLSIVGPPHLRSRFSFNLKVGDSTETLNSLRSKKDTVVDRFTRMIEDDVYPLVLRAREAYKHIRVYYTGDSISSYEVTRTLMFDLLWGIGSIMFVFTYTFLHTRSVIVTIGGMLVIFFSIPIAYVLTPAVKTTMASFLALFLITGIGVDAIFVFVDFWDQSARLRDRDSRIVFLLIQAGKSCLATSLTTAVSFLANLASVLQPLREFGLFMGLCVIMAFILVLLFVPAFLLIQERRRRRRLRHTEIDFSIPQETALAVVPAPSPAVKKGEAPDSPSPGQHGMGRLARRRYAILFNLATCSARCPIAIVVLAVLIVALSLVGVAFEVELDTGLPTIFPDDHNQVAGKEVLAKFGDVKDLGGTEPTRAGAACSPQLAFAEDQQSCFMHWCDATPVAGTVEGVEAECWRGPTEMRDNSSLTWTEVGWDNADCFYMTVANRLISPFSPESDRWTLAWRGASSSWLNWTHRAANSPYHRLTALAPVNMEEWETGSVYVSELWMDNHQRFTRAQIAPAPEDSAPYCRIATMCSLGKQTCQMPGWRRMGVLSVPGASPATTDAPPRALQSFSRPTWVPSTVAERLRVSVRVVYGLLSPSSTPLVGPQDVSWAFDPTYEPSNPWSQRAMHGMCADVHQALQVVSEDCWPEMLRKFVQGRDQRFPSRTFDEDVAAWFYSNRIVASYRLWFVDKKVRASTMLFEVNVASNIQSAKALEYMKLWDAYVEAQNAKASTTGNRAWHTSSLWVRAEAEIAIVSSTQLTIILSAVCGGFGVLLFTLDPWLTLIVLTIVIGVMICLGGFMIVLMGWAIGPIEVIALVVFIGYSVTYSLHVAHDYSRVREGSVDLRNAQAHACRKAGVPEGDIEAEISKPLAPHELRRARARVAVLRMGGATLSSGASTIGTSTFLLVCTLTIFPKLGAVVIAVTLISVIAALVVLPAVLSLVGPGPTPLYVRCARYLRVHVLDRVLPPGWRRDKSHRLLN